MNDSNGFPEYKQMLLDDRRANREAFEKLFNELRALHDDVLTLKIKMKITSAAWGGASGIVVIVVAGLILAAFV